MRVLSRRTQLNANISCTKHPRGKSGRAGRKLSMSFTEDQRVKIGQNMSWISLRNVLRMRFENVKLFSRIRNLKIQKFIDIVMHNA